jgi:hypothetical protein
MSRGYLRGPRSTHHAGNSLGVTGEHVMHHAADDFPRGMAVTTHFGTDLDAFALWSPETTAIQPAFQMHCLFFPMILVMRLCDRD